MEADGSQGVLEAVELNVGLCYNTNYKYYLLTVSNEDSTKRRKYRAKRT